MDAISFDIGTDEWGFYHWGKEFSDEEVRDFFKYLVCLKRFDGMSKYTVKNVSYSSDEKSFEFVCYADSDEKALEKLANYFQLFNEVVCKNGNREIAELAENAMKILGLFEDPVSRHSESIDVDYYSIRISSNGWVVEDEPCSRGPHRVSIFGNAKKAMNVVAKAVDNNRVSMFKNAKKVVNVATKVVEDRIVSIF